MENDFYGGIVAGIIAVAMFIAMVLCIGTKYQELNKRAEEYNKEILRILDGE